MKVRVSISSCVQNRWALHSSKPTYPENTPSFLRAHWSIEWIFWTARASWSPFTVSREMSSQ